MCATSATLPAPSSIYIHIYIYILFIRSPYVFHIIQCIHPLVQTPGGMFMASTVITSDGRDMVGSIMGIFFVYIYLFVCVRVRVCACVQLNG